MKIVIDSPGGLDVCRLKVERAFFRKCLIYVCAYRFTFTFSMLRKMVQIVIGWVKLALLKNVFFYRDHGTCVFVSPLLRLVSACGQRPPSVLMGKWENFVY
jgi:hypothetical protein